MKPPGVAPAGTDDALPANLGIRSVHADPGLRPWGTAPATANYRNHARAGSSTRAGDVPYAASPRHESALGDGELGLGSSTVMPVGRNSNERFAEATGWSVSEVQFRMAGVRIELLEIATSYGLMRASQAGGRHGLSDWREWVAYVQRLNVLGLGGAASGIAKHLAGASPVSQDALDHRIHEWPRQDWWKRLESLAESARSVEELSRPDVRMVPLNEVLGVSTPGGFALLGAIEDSLILQLYSQGSERSSRLHADEIYELLVVARGEGVWEWEQPVDDQYPRKPYIPAGPLNTNMPDMVQLFKRLMRQAAKSTELYRRLAPDGRELSELERLAVREQLVVGATALRQLAHLELSLTGLLPKTNPPTDFRLVGEEWRRKQRSLILSLSDSPTVRSRSYPADALVPCES